MVYTDAHKRVPDPSHSRTSPTCFLDQFSTTSVVCPVAVAAAVSLLLSWALLLSAPILPFLNRPPPSLTLWLPSPMTLPPPSSSASPLPVVFESPPLCRFPHAVSHSLCRQHCLLLPLHQRYPEVGHSNPKWKYLRTKLDTRHKKNQKPKNANKLP